MKDSCEADAAFLAISEDLKGVEKILSGLVESAEVPVIKDVANHIIMSGGKRIRPALTILSSKICGHTGEDALHLGVAIELIHTASLIHDDVLDCADTRRGVESVNAKWGNHLSILVGDYCLSLSSFILANKATPGIISILTEAAKKTTEGEVLEVVCGNDLSMDKDTYLDIIRRKTAELMSASCETGSMLAEAPAKLSSSLKEYGLNLGMAFQIIDDILDYTVDSANLGKCRGTDLKEGKLTLPVIYALERSSASEKGVIKESLLTPICSDDHFRLVVNILDKYDCITDARKTAQEFSKRAARSLELFKPSLEKDALTKLTFLILNRRS